MLELFATYAESQEFNEEAADYGVNPLAYQLSVSILCSACRALQCVHRRVGALAHFEQSGSETDGVIDCRPDGRASFGRCRELTHPPRFGVMAVLVESVVVRPTDCWSRRLPLKACTTVNHASLPLCVEHFTPHPEAGRLSPFINL